MTKRKVNEHLTNRADQIRIAMGDDQRANILVEDLKNATTNYIQNPSTENEAELQNNMSKGMRFLRGLVVVSLILVCAYFALGGTFPTWIQIMN